MERNYSSTKYSLVLSFVSLFNIITGLWVPNYDYSLVNSGEEASLESGDGVQKAAA